MAAIFKMAEKLIFYHNSVSFEHFYVRFLDLSFHFSRKYFTEEKFLDSKWRLMSKMAAEIQWSIDVAFSNTFAFCFLQCVSIFVRNMDQEHIFIKIVKNGDSIQNGGSKSDFLT
jgi:hypothetical protein